MSMTDQQYQSRLDAIRKCVEHGYTDDSCGMAVRDVHFLVAAMDAAANKWKLNPTWQRMDDKCKQCGGNGSVDTGAMRPDGEWYYQPCLPCLGTGHASVALLQWAQELLANATPNKTLPDDKSAQWCQQFGKFWAVSQELTQMLTKTVNAIGKESFLPVDKKDLLSLSPADIAQGNPVCDRSPDA